MVHSWNFFPPFFASHQFWNLSHPSHASLHLIHSLLYSCSHLLLQLSAFLFCPNLGFPGGSEVKASACNVGDPGSITGLGRSPGNGNHSSILAWRVPWTKDPGRLQPAGSQRVNFHFHFNDS